MGKLKNIISGDTVIAVLMMIVNDVDDGEEKLVSLKEFPAKYYFL